MWAWPARATSWDGVKEVIGAGEEFHHRACFVWVLSKSGGFTRFLA